ncbi:MAG: hypothetical protein J1F04_01610 [Oscillospiraceae bacterium]|nr:hypothetical protein [Oscillospiraceae bacterium]
MGKTSSTVKNRYAAKNYDMVRVLVKKGEKDRYKGIADKMGLSMSQLFVQAVEEYITAHNTKN